MPAEPTPLHRDGLSQAQRHLPALDPAFARLDERTPDELLAFAKAYAETAKIRFFATNGPDASTDVTTWASLMTAPGKKSVAALEARADNPPHLALFLAFLKLFGLAQDQLNNITQRHLDFYYRDVLRLRPLAAVPDEVHLTFELARNVAEYLLPAGTGFDAGPDASKRPQLYRSATKRLVNRARLGQLRTVYLDAAKSVIPYAPQAPSADGKGAPLPSTDPTWNAFGPAPYADLYGSGSSESVWPIATVGFALAAPLLQMAEGTRKVTVLLNSAVSVTPPAGLRVQLSGPDSWIEPAALVPLVRSGNGPYQYTLDFTIPATELRPVVGYNAAVLGGGYTTNAPVLRVLLTRPSHYLSLQSLVITSARVQIEVDGITKSLGLANDLGPINPEKPFLPFGSSPAAGSTLFVSCAEASGKPLTSVRAYIPDWIGKPSNWASYYAAYNHDAAIYASDDVPLNTTIINHLVKDTAVPQNTVNPSQEVGLFREATVSSPNFLTKQSLSLNYSYENGTPKTYKSRVDDTPNDYEQAVLPGRELLVTFTLKRGLGHSVYPALLATYNKTSNGSLENPPNPPNPPYTPLAQSLVLGYSADSGAIVLSSTTTARKALRLFHQGVSGWAEESAALKRSMLFLGLARSNAYLLPQYTTGGTFFLSLTEARPLDTVAVLFQVAEGSAIPGPRPTRVVWSVLCQNQWFELKDGYAPFDATDNLLTSGIIEFTLPAETTTNNTLLEAGQVWLRAELYHEYTPAEVEAGGSLAPRMPAAPETVARLVGIHPQAVRARFDDQANDAAHYAAPLPAGTISKARPAIGALKATQQPYPAFGGKAAESERAFYTRVSERLRHKRRAVSIWDYEHLVLEQFPDLGKVKCLPHTKVLTEPSGALSLKQREPGCVTLLVVPRLGGSYASYQLAPRASVHQLQAVREFVQALAGPQVEVFVANPVYQPVLVTAKVQLRPGYQAALYLPQLQQELRAYLAPWQRTPAAELSFGGRVERSSVIAFLDQRPYVDFVTDVSIQFPGQAANESLQLTAEWLVLTSVATHALDIYHSA